MFESKELLQKAKDEITAKIIEIDRLRSENTKLKDQEIEKERFYEIIKDGRYTYLLDKGDLRTSKMNIDLMQLVNTPQYQSLHDYLLMQAAAIFQKTKGDFSHDSCYLLCQFAHFLENQVAELDRMKDPTPEEQASEDPYAP